MSSQFLINNNLLDTCWIQISVNIVGIIFLILDFRILLAPVLPPSDRALTARYYKVPAYLGKPQELLCKCFRVVIINFNYGQIVIQCHHNPIVFYVVQQRCQVNTTAATQKEAMALNSWSPVRFLPQFTSRAVLLSRVSFFLKILVRAFNKRRGDYGIEYHYCCIDIYRRGYGFFRIAGLRKLFIRTLESWHHILADSLISAGNRFLKTSLAFFGILRRFSGS